MANRSRRPPPMPERALLTRRQVAALLGVGYDTVKQLVADEYLPEPIQFPQGGAKHVRWRRDELKAWIIAGCPPRTRWTWEPTRLPALRELVEGASRQHAALLAQIDRAKAELDGLHAQAAGLERERDGRRRAA